jgi:hypothetical protein
MAKRMKEIFRCYYGLEESEYAVLWDSAIFIFDANVLLNLYRYKEKTRNELLDVIDKLKNRLWIPHQVGLEFQRNRITVINEQNKKFYKVKEIMENHISGIEKEFKNIQIDKKHANIDTTDVISSLKNIKKDFLSKLDELENGSIKFNSNDEIRDRLDDAIQENIGPQPENQEYLENLYKEGEQRFNSQIPPGYKDNSKDDKEFIFSGLKYKNKYGDLIVWKQIIVYAKDKNIKNIIFVTDDNKDDWWLKDNNKIVDVRHELRDEIYREAEVERFQMYSSEKFIEYANKFLDTKISESAIEEIRGMRQYDESRKATAENSSLMSEAANAALIRGKDFQLFLPKNLREAVNFSRASALAAYDKMQKDAQEALELCKATSYSSLLSEAAKAVSIGGNMSGAIDAERFARGIAASEAGLAALKGGISTELAVKAASGSAIEAVSCKLSAVTAGYDKFDKK